MKTRRFFVLLMGLMLVALLPYDFGPPDADGMDQNLIESEYKLPVEAIPILVLKTVIPEVIIASSCLYEVRSNEINDNFYILNPCLTVMPDVRKIINRGLFEGVNYITYYIDENKGINLNEQQVRRMSAQILMTKGLSLFSNRMDTYRMDSST